MARRLLGVCRAMPQPDSPHDKLFREAFSSPEAARGILQSVLPPGLRAKLDLTELIAVPGTFIDEELRGSQSDALFSTKFAGRPALVYLLLEHKSWVDRWVGLQLLRYVIRAWERELTRTPRPEALPLIIPIVVYHGDSAWTAPLALWDLLDPSVREEPSLGALIPSFSYVVDDLTEATDEALVSRALGLFGTLAAVFLRDARRPERVLPMLRRMGSMLAELWRAPDGGRAVGILLRYLWAVVDVSQEEVTASVERCFPEARELAMTIAERLRQEGLAQGLEKGRQEGHQEGRKEGHQEGRQEGLRVGMLGGRIRTLRRQLELRFGELTPLVVERLEFADEAALDRFAERVLTARSLDEVLAGR